MLKPGLICLLLASVTVNAYADLLKPGSPAPKLDVRSWVKGNPVKQFEPGKTYVVEFWATWCGPCIENIPKLTALAKSRRDITVIGVSVFEENKNSEVQKFVTAMGDKMDYLVAYSGDQDKMAKTWMGEAKQSGIPTAFVVHDQKIVWIGHPFGLETVIGKLDKGELDVAANAKKFEERIARQDKERAIEDETQKIRNLISRRKYAEATKKIEKLELEPLAKTNVADLKFHLLAHTNPEQFKAECRDKIAKNDSERGKIGFFAYINADSLPELAKWIAAETTSKGERSDWYPFLNAGRTYFKLKEYDLALDMIEKSKQCILDYQKQNPDSPKGNAIEVLEKLEMEVKKAKGVG